MKRKSSVQASEEVLGHTVPVFDEVFVKLFNIIAMKMDIDQFRDIMGNLSSEDGLPIQEA